MQSINDNLNDNEKQNAQHPARRSSPPGRLGRGQRMKQEDIKEWAVRPMSKSELAMAYAPHLTQGGAVNRLMDWIHHNPELTEALLRSGYRKSQKLLTSLQVRTIFSYLGEP